MRESSKTSKSIRFIKKKKDDQLFLSEWVRRFLSHAFVRNISHWKVHSRYLSSTKNTAADKISSRTAMHFDIYFIRLTKKFSFKFLLWAPYVNMLWKSNLRKKNEFDNRQPFKSSIYRLLRGKNIIAFLFDFS